MIPLEQIRRIVFIRTDRLGETLLNLPAVAALKAGLPQASLTLLVHPQLQPLLASLPGVERVLTLDAGGEGAWGMRAIRLGQRLRAHRFDLAMVSNPKKEVHAAVWLAGIPIRVGYDRKWGGLLTHRLPERRALGERHEVEHNLDLLRVLGVPIAAPSWQLPRFEREQRDALRLLEQQGIPPSEPFMAVHPWTSNPAKQWPAARFQQLIRTAWESLRLRAAVIGGAESVAHAGTVLPVECPVANLVGRLTLSELAGLLQRAALLVSNDSGPVHLAAAVHTKTVVLFGTTDPATGPTRWGPWGSGHLAIWKPSMDAITVDEVLAAVRQQLA